MKDNYDSFFRNENLIVGRVTKLYKTSISRINKPKRINPRKLNTWIMRNKNLLPLKKCSNLKRKSSFQVKPILHIY